MTKADSDATKIALINNNIAFIQKDIGEIKGGIKELAGVYATREQLIEVAKDTELRLTRLEGQSNLWRWMNPLLSSAFTALVTFLLINYIQGLP